MCGRRCAAGTAPSGRAPAGTPAILGYTPAQRFGAAAGASDPHKGETVKIVLVGAGSAQFGFGMLGDIFSCPALAGSEVALVDINPEALARVASTAGAFVKERKLPFTIASSVDRREALAKADVVVISIEVGDRFALWDLDWNLPLQFGIRQVYGENGGPGGLFHALRIIPPILDICGDVLRLAPAARVFNFSNPMSRICTTVQRKYPDLRLVGLCHEIASLERDLPKLLDLPFDRMDVVAAGLNHFSFLLEARERGTGRDLYPEILAKAPAYYAGKKEHGLFRMLLERFGRLPVTTDSHFGEHIQWAWDVVDHRGILDFYAAYQKYCAKRAFAMGEPSRERVIPMIEALAGGAPGRELAVNVLNGDCIPDLPCDIAVEVPADVDAKGVHPRALPPVPRGIAGLWRNQVAVHDLCTEAILKKSRNLALQALLVDPVVHSVRAAEETLDTILDRQKDYLGYLQ